MEIISSSTSTTASSDHRRKSTTRTSTNSSSSSSSTISISVAAGSVWESRMKIDEVKGGIKVFNGATKNCSEESDHSTSNQRATFFSGRTKRLPPLGTGIVGIGKRKTWKGENSDNRNSPNQKDKSEMQRNFVDDNNGADRKSPIQIKKTRSNSTPMSPRSPNLRKTKSESGKSSPSNTQSINNGSRLRKSKSEPNRASISGNTTDESTETERSSPQTSKMSPATGDCDSSKIIDSSGIDDGEEEENENADADGIAAEDLEVLKESGSGSDNDVCKEFGVCQEELISAGSIDVGQVEVPAVKLDDLVFVGNEEEDEEEVDEEIEMDELENNFDDDVKEMNGEMEIKDKNVLNDVKKSMISQVNNSNVNANSSSLSPIITKRLFPTTPKKQTPTVVNNFSKPRPTSIPSSVIDESNGVTAETTHGRLQSLVDLVMWRDVSRSAFVFGIGTFMIISSSYTKDLNISSISVMSYLGLIYLGLIFLYRSILCRGMIEDSSHSGQHNVLGEDEAMWVIRIILPYLNEFLLKLGDLFSGDPAMTMKLAVVLFVLARCGSFFTVWKMVKLGFLGVFIVPKICCSYSSYITAHGTFWIRRFQDAWESCSHKKAVAFAIFTLVWNLSSVIARVWAAFMLFVAFRYYQQHYMIKEDQWVHDHVDGIVGGGRAGAGGGRRTGGGAAAVNHQVRPRQMGVRQVGQWRTGTSADLRKQRKCA